MTENNIQLMGQVNTIALATDGSEFNDGAAQETIFFAQACGAKIVVLHVIGIDSESATGVHASSVAVRQEVKDYIDNIKRMANDNNLDCEVVVEESYQPDKTIVELACRHDADILIMGRHGRKGLMKLLVGSMTSKVIGHGFPKVLVVPKKFSIGGEKILIAVDGSDFSEMAADEAISIGASCTALKKVYVLSVATNESNLDKAQELVNAVCKTGKEKAPKVEFEPLALVGRPSQVIADTAKEKDVDMILAGGHGKGLGKLLMGHVTEKVIGRAHCAVLVVEKKK